MNKFKVNSLLLWFLVAYFFREEQFFGCFYDKLFDSMSDVTCQKPITSYCVIVITHSSYSHSVTLDVLYPVIALYYILQCWFRQSTNCVFNLSNFTSLSHIQMHLGAYEECETFKLMLQFHQCNQN